jgi:MFS family permease
MRTSRYLRRQAWLVMTVVLLVVMAAIATTVGFMYRAFEMNIAPQMMEKARTTGQSLGGLMGQAAAFDIPVEKLMGVDTLFAETLRKHPEVAGISLFNQGEKRVTQGVTVPAEMTVRIPVQGYAATQAELRIGIDPAVIQKLFREMSLDLLVVAVVTLFISLELLYFLAGDWLTDLARIRAQTAAMGRGAFVTMPTANRLGSQLSHLLATQTAAVRRQYDACLLALRERIRARHAGSAADANTGADADARTMLRSALSALRSLRTRFDFIDVRQSRGSTDAAMVLGAMRAPFFLLLLADDLSRSFLPLFAAGLSIGPLSVSPNMVASLPIAVFMLVVALSQPVLGGWSERIGRRRSFLVGAVLACFAHFLSAQSSSLIELLIWRGLGGAAWAIAFVAAQGYILDHTDAKSRTTGLAAFVGIIMVSLICGPSIGGILADGIGYRPTLALGGVLTLLSLWLAWRKLPVHRKTEVLTTAAAMTANSKPRLGIAFANRRFLSLLLLAALPAKLILIGYCYYLIPLFIINEGSTSSMAGRLIMLYSVMMVLLVPPMASWVVALRVRRSKEPEALFVALGLALSGIAGLAMALPLGFAAPLVVVLLLGIGQALSISPQAAMVAEVCKDEIRTLGQSAVYGVYRMVERLGNALGPIIAAALLEWTSFRTAFVAIGLFLLICASLFAMVFLWRPKRLIAPTASAEASV